MSAGMLCSGVHCEADRTTCLGDVEMQVCQTGLFIYSVAAGVNHQRQYLCQPKGTHKRAELCAGATCLACRQRVYWELPLHNPMIAINHKHAAVKLLGTFRVHRGSEHICTSSLAVVSYASALQSSDIFLVISSTRPVAAPWHFEGNTSHPCCIDM